jgi:hypothetical protein
MANIFKLKIGDKVVAKQSVNGFGDIGMSGLTYATPYLIAGKEYEVVALKGYTITVWSEDGLMGFNPENFE